VFAEEQYVIRTGNVERTKYWSENSKICINTN